MKSRLVTTVAAVLLIFAWKPLEGAETLSPRELKKIEKQAAKAEKAGDRERAVELFRQILMGTESGDPQRGSALYAVAISELANSNPGDRGLVRSYLEELASSHPRHARGAEVALVNALLSEIDGSRDQLERLKEENERAAATARAEREQIESECQEIAGQGEAADDKVRSLQAQLRRTRANLESTQAELATKEEALQKLKDALVGGAGSSR